MATGRFERIRSLFTPLEQSRSAAPKLEFIQDELNNGLRVCFCSLPHTALVGINLGIWVGARDDRVGEAGFAHLIEHSVFAGGRQTANQAEVWRETVIRGATLNAGTGIDWTHYYATTLPQHAPDVVALLVDIVFEAALREEAINTEKNVVLREMRDRGSSDDCYRQFRTLLYPEGQLNAEILGEESSIRGAAPDAVKSCYTRHYSTANAVLCVTGRIAGEVRRGILNVLKQVPQRSYFPQTRAPVALGNKRLILQQTQGNSLHYRLGFRQDREILWPDPAWDAAKTIFADTRLSRLAGRIHHLLGIAYSYDFLEGFISGVPGYLCLSSSSTPSDFRLFVGSAREIAESLVMDGPLQREFLDTQDYLRHWHLRRMSDPAWVSEGLAWLLLTEGSLDRFAAYSEGIEQLSQERVAELLRQALAAHNLRLAVVGSASIEELRELVQ